MTEQTAPAMPPPAEILPDRDGVAFNRRDHENCDDRIGFTARERAAIDLCMPDSGTAWLDAMIQHASTERLAAHIAGGMVGRMMCEDPGNTREHAERARTTAEIAVAMAGVLRRTVSDPMAAEAKP